MTFIKKTKLKINSNAKQEKIIVHIIKLMPGEKLMMEGNNTPGQSAPYMDK
ncbi:hypothetical protein ACO0KY_02980 [Undibacterium sp. Dicai25W]|uniref:hypothetical protein n=1 Tax=Undibacterium sp. Dicai25W TaxID=3413034 RepID=UPI003BF369E7